MVWTNSYYHFDAVGSTRGITGADQNFQATYPQLGFGQQLVTTSTVANPFRFNGQVGYYQDTSTGLHNVRQRVYDSSLARWSSQDPIRSDDNLFRYVVNSPTQCVDPSGLQGQPAGQGSLRRRLYSEVDDWGYGTSTGWTALDAPAAFLGSWFGNLVGKPAVFLVTNWREDTESERVNAILVRQAVVNRSAEMNAWTAGVNLYAGATTDRIAYGLVGYDPIEDRELTLSESVQNVAGGTAGYAATWIPVAGVTQRITATGVGTGAAARYPAYMYFRRQGFNAAQANYLSKPYARIGHHFPLRQAIGNRLRVPKFIIDSPLNVLRPRGMSRGLFYELHYRVDPTFYYAPFPRTIGGGWRGGQIGLQKYGIVGRTWYGTSAPLKETIGVGAGLIEMTKDNSDDSF
jgi:RHS repeat-associated protein